MLADALKRYGLDNDAINRVASLVTSAFGRGTAIERLERIDQGASKLTFKFHAGLEGEFILQVWKNPRPELTQIAGPDIDLLWPCGIERAVVNTRFLESIGVRVPRLCAVHPGDAAGPGMLIMECISGAPFTAFGGKKTSDSTFEKIGDLAGRLHARTSSRPGIVPGGKPEEKVKSFSCLELVRSIAVKELKIAGEYDAFIRAERAVILDRLDRLQCGAAAREEYNLIHGDSLQMIIDRSGSPVLIDLDSVQYFDLEYEYCALDLPDMDLLSKPAFFRSYHRHVRPRLDRRRLAFYRICRLISWISYFSEAFSTSGNPALKVPHENSVRWLAEALARSEREGADR